VAAASPHAQPLHGTLQPVLADNLLRMAGGQKPQYRIGGIHLHGNAGGLAIGQITPNCGGTDSTSMARP
jgi:hypothetical protein